MPRPSLLHHPPGSAQPLSLGRQSNHKPLLKQNVPSSSVSAVRSLSPGAVNVLLSQAINQLLAQTAEQVLLGTGSQLQKPPTEASTPSRTYCGGV